MRTTLKRGIGQVAGLDGNGHGGLPPAFGPIARYQQSGPPKRPLKTRILRGFLWFALAILVLGSGVAGGLYLYAHETLDALKLGGKVAKKAQKYVSYVPPGAPAIALIAGYDHRAGTGSTSYAGSNSDTLMLMRADPKNNTLSILSFPRDLWVPIYCSGNTPSFQNRVNAAWGLCGSNGPAAVLDTMEHLTGLHINYLITLDFHAFKQIVNRMHGVYMNVDRRYYNPLGTGWSAINLQPGYQKLDGGQALQFVRFRHLDSDIYRTARQQLFVEALKSRLRTELSITDPTLLLQLIHALKGNLAYVKAGGGDVGLDEIKSYFGLLFHLPAGHLVRNAIPLQDLQSAVIGGADVLTAQQTVIDQTVNGFLHPSVPSVSKPHHGKTHKLPRKEISALVLNGGNVTGEAANTNLLLKKAGYTTKKLPATTPANAPAATKDTILYYYAGNARAELAAKQLQPLFGAARIAKMGPAIALFAQKAHNPLLVVSVGTSFSGKLHLPRAPGHATGPAPQVSDGVSVTEAALRSAPGPHFHVMVPHEVALYSQLSQDEGVRVFKPLQNQHELVMTFNIGGGVEYWQIEETSWNSAPILQNPTSQFTYRREHFSVYTTGGAIQMVALRTKTASYWVTNTLLNSLSNSTMLAIAKSLQPLHR